MRRSASHPFRDTRHSDDEDSKPPNRRRLANPAAARSAKTPFRNRNFLEALTKPALGFIRFGTAFAP